MQKNNFKNSRKPLGINDNFSKMKRHILTAAVTAIMESITCKC